MRPLGSLPPSLVKTWGFLRYMTISSSSAFACYGRLEKVRFAPVQLVPRTTDTRSTRSVPRDYCATFALKRGTEHVADAEMIPRLAASPCTCRMRSGAPRPKLPSQTHPLAVWMIWSRERTAKGSCYNKVTRHPLLQHEARRSHLNANYLNSKPPQKTSRPPRKDVSSLSHGVLSR